MTQATPIQIPPYQIPSQPNYNAVKIDIHNPQVNPPGYTQSPVLANNYTSPVYSYPKIPIYELPKQSVYEQPKNIEKSDPVQEVVPVVPVKPAVPVPPPVIVQPTVTPVPAPVVKAPEAKTPVAPIVPVQTVEVKAPVTEAPVVKAPEAKAPVTPIVPVQTVEVKAPEVITPKIDVNDFITKLKSSNYDQQAAAIGEIANIVTTSPQNAVDLLDVRVVDTLLNIMNKDSSQLAGPTPQQLQIREKIVNGEKVSEAEMAEANKVTPMELAERNKLFAVATVVMLQKLYSSEIEKMNNTVEPLTQLPGAAGLVEQIKNNPNPVIRAAGINALSSLQRPEYKKDLTTLFSVAKNDQDAGVQQAATKALEKLTQIPDVTKPVPVTETQKTT